ncbi:MAG: hypothetical protein N2Z85_02285 [Patescibacteria group bacterium]|nr:hypothetical protein [Patescibacteria group bacterium]
MFILKQQKNNFILKIKNFWDNLMQKKDILITQINNQKIYLLAYKEKNGQKNILGAEIILIKNLIENINNYETKESFKFLLEEFFKKNKIKPQFIINIINEKDYIYKIISISYNLKIEELKNVIKNEVNNNEVYYIEPINIIYENQKINHQDYALWTLNKNYIDKINNIFQTINLNIFGLCPENKTIVKAILPEFQTKNAYLIINISESKTNFIIFSGKTIHFSGISEFNLLNIEKNFNDFLEEINKLIYYYATKCFHEHGASSKINKILVIGNLNNNLTSLIALNTKIKIEKIKINLGQFRFKNEKIKELIMKNESDFSSLIGFILDFNLQTIKIKQNI